MWGISLFELRPVEHGMVWQCGILHTHSSSDLAIARWVSSRKCHIEGVQFRAQAVGTPANEGSWGRPLAVPLDKPSLSFFPQSASQAAWCQVRDVLSVLVAAVWCPEIVAPLPRPHGTNNTAVGTQKQPLCPQTVSPPCCWQAALGCSAPASHLIPTLRSLSFPVDQSMFENTGAATVPTPRSQHVPAGATPQPSRPAGSQHLRNLGKAVGAKMNDLLRRKEPAGPPDVGVMEVNTSAGAALGVGQPAREDG